MSLIDWINRLFVISKEEPVVQKEEPIVQKEEPIVQKEEPIVQKEEPVDTKMRFNKNDLKKRHSKKQHSDSK
jgi:hypothetical protein